MDDGKKGGQAAAAPLHHTLYLQRGRLLCAGKVSPTASLPAPYLQGTVPGPFSPAGRAARFGSQAAPAGAPSAFATEQARSVTREKAAAQTRLARRTGQAGAHTPWRAAPPAKRNWFFPPLRALKNGPDPVRPGLVRPKQARIEPVVPSLTFSPPPQGVALPGSGQPIPLSGPGFWSWPG